jgi:hypothetical protein
MSKQLTLFRDTKPERSWRIQALAGYAYIAEPFDFERDGDHPRMIPRRNWKPPEWLALLMDDPHWMPDMRI